MNTMEMHKVQKIQRLGMRKQNNDGAWMTIIKYNNAQDMTVQFDSGYIVDHIYYTTFCLGQIKDLLYPVVSGVGFFGVGKYSASKNYKTNLAYTKWVDMIHRCYKHPTDAPAYQDCIVCDEWHNYQNFAQWFEENYYEVPNHSMSLDKDIIKKKNRIYTPEYCCFLPRNINTIFEGLNHRQRGGKHPIGVDAPKLSTRYTAYTHRQGKKIHLGTYDTPEEAFYAYKKAKEAYIKEMADKYKEWLPQKVYDAMYAYEIEIDD